jgi:hypothetical protein
MDEIIASMFATVVNEQDIAFLNRCREQLANATPGSGTWYVQQGLASYNLVTRLVEALGAIGISARATSARMDGDLLEVVV